MNLQRLENFQFYYLGPAFHVYILVAVEFMHMDEAEQKSELKPLREYWNLGSNKPEQRPGFFQKRPGQLDVLIFFKSYHNRHNSILVRLDFQTDLFFLGPALRALLFRVRGVFFTFLHSATTDFAAPPVPQTACTLYFP